MCASRPHSAWRARCCSAACCARHKTEPLFDALAGYDVWFAASWREQSPSRSQLAEVAPVRLPAGGLVSKVSPLASWTMRNVEAYATVHGIGCFRYMREATPASDASPAPLRHQTPAIRAQVGGWVRNSNAEFIWKRGSRSAGGTD